MHRLIYKAPVPPSGQYTYYPGTSPIPEASAANAHAVSFKVLAQVAVEPGTQGIIFAQASTSQRLLGVRGMWDPKSRESQAVFRCTHCSRPGARGCERSQKDPGRRAVGGVSLWRRPVAFRLREILEAGQHILPTEVQFCVLEARHPRSGAMCRVGGQAGRARRLDYLVRIDLRRRPSQFWTRDCSEDRVPVGMVSSAPGLR
jgi:hypothetical protein